MEYLGGKKFHQLIRCNASKVQELIRDGGYSTWTFTGQLNGHSFFCQCEKPTKVKMMMGMSSGETDYTGIKVLVEFLILFL